MLRQNHETVVRRGGFLTALVHGVFGLLIAVIICGAGVGLYAMNIVDRKADKVLNISGDVLESLPETLPQLVESLPPALADAINDVRDPAYRDKIDLDVRLGAPGGRHGAREVIIHANNRGDQTVTLLAVRVVLVDENEDPVRAVATYAATPLAIENEWRGPLMPGSERICSLHAWHSEGDLSPRVEITDLRVWRGPAGDQAD
jgi:hypothetical protein